MVLWNATAIPKYRSEITLGFGVCLLLGIAAPFAASPYLLGDVFDPFVHNTEVKQGA